MATPNPPLTLTPATRLQPVNPRSSSRSPARSPLRKSQFAARELDPLLSNLSPDSTLKALQTTATITSGSSGQDALAKSIAEASPTEREIGIRAAVAAQKLREWYQEVSRWPWPARRDRGWGAGFLPPQRSTGVSPPPDDVPYLGFLPSATVYEYEERIEDIRDGTEALELEEVKDHIFSAHVPERSVSASHMPPQSSSTKSTGYGRMRDFTALITATVIQALPQLANLTLLLDTWEIRLSVLRQIPDITQNFRSTQAGIQTAFQVVRGPETGPLVTMEEYEIAKPILGGKVAALGSRIDKLLDMLEGQDDSLPKRWIDTLENIENEYAAWAVEAEHVAIRNDLLSKALAEQPKAEQSQEQTTPDTPASHNDDSRRVVRIREPATEDREIVDLDVGTPVAELPSSDYFSRPSPGQRFSKKFDAPHKSPLKPSTSTSGHNRTVSEVSQAGSTFSAMSDISAAEIVDATSTKVTASPKISVIDNPFKPSRDELSWFAKPGATATKDGRPPMLQRASTASIEVVSRSAIKQVTLTRSRSHDMLSDSASSSPDHPGTPSQALQQLIGPDSRTSPPLEEFSLDHDPLKDANGLRPILLSPTISPSPSLRVEPLQIKGRESANLTGRSPNLPRRSSKRLSQNLDPDNVSPTLPGKTEADEEPSSESIGAVTPVERPTGQQNESLESKITDILSRIPTRIRLAKDHNHDEPQSASSTASTRSSTPAPSFTLSPVKTDRIMSQTAPGDVRMFHLTRSGQTRDSPPVKLFVRAVGEHGERVMVRVGGGWADLAEYLREYSLHHGHRGLASDSLEVSSFPTSHAHQREGSKASVPSTPTSQSKPSTTSVQDAANPHSFRSTSPGFDDSPELVVVKSRRSGPDKSADRSSFSQSSDWTPPPVPSIPRTYTTQTPTMVTSTINGVSNTTMMEPFHQGMSSNSSRAVSSPVHTSRSSDGRVQSSTFISSTPSPGGGRYTPLGAAGPKSYGRHPGSQNQSPVANRESWVEGMVGKARAVSGGSTVVYGPTTTTTTTVVSRSSPRSRRVSALAGPSTPSNGYVSAGPVAASSSSVSPESGSPGLASPGSLVSVESPPVRAKNRLSLSDVGGIKRVFLRRKSDR